ncbi:dTDP-4-dehydrorhamnose 3,5-epimerase [Novosphingobium sediminicola]|uniref:dTDP-4-dehydrorhamnose 3,5-epimerase n=1 Tax=Novosphingobium sediminicola TaxID=563162 RepID=A0A7W6CJN8_9SPHN|nr:dTDP-4-dehydrorhamnose 3,5-epimerase [Novosphingobium sediminicola]
MNFRLFDISGPVEVVPRKLGDERGYFTELFREDRFAEYAGGSDFVQENQSLSSKVGTIRGLHFQSEPMAQGKLVRCVAGAIFDVAVDIRHGSPTFGKWIAVELTPDACNQLWVPPGFAHGFCTLKPDTVVCYKVTSYYSAECDKGTRWDDPAIGIVWPDVADDSTLSGKDAIQPLLADLPEYFRMGADR